MAARKNTSKTRRLSAFRPRLENLERRLNPSVFPVTTTADNGDNDLPTPGSLREGIKFINAGTLGFSDITFSLPPGSTITPPISLPAIFDSSCMIFAAPPGGGIGVRLHGSGSAASAPGLHIFGSGVLVRGLSITGFSEAIRIEGSGCIIQSNFIGVGYGGTTAIPNGAGITINGDGNLIGGLLEGNKNTISGNLSVGIEIKSSPDGSVTSDSNLIYGNNIGVSAGGTIALPNGTHGIRIDRGSGNVIGGDDALDGLVDTFVKAANIISSNGGYGIDVMGSTATSTKIQGNVIIDNDLDGIHATNVPGLLIGGTTPGAGNLISINGMNGIKLDGDGSLPAMTAGTTIKQNRIGVDPFDFALPNTKNGIQIFFSGNNTIGGTTAGERNIISANIQSGIAMAGSLSTGNIVQGNFIGTKSDGKTAQGNKLEGIYVTSGASKNMIGGSAAGAGNVIAFNGEFAGTMGLKGHGVLIDSGTKNTISRNSIFDNYGRGIDLRKTTGVHDGFTVNDTYKTADPNDGDPDTGANDLQDYPVVISRAQGAAHTGIHTWQLSSKPNNNYTIEFFKNTKIDPSGFGEGEVYLDSVTDKTNAQGNLDIPFDHAGMTFVSATATDSEGNTSEFSMVDTDADGLADAWELGGKGLDVNEDGVIEIELSLLGASSVKKDIFVEVDAMVGFVPDPAVLTAVETAFSLAPDAKVHNPDGSVGITLHAILSDVDIPAADFGVGAKTYWPEFEAIKNTTVGTDGKPGSFGNTAQRISANWPQIKTALTYSYRYCMFAKTYNGKGSSGVAEMPDFPLKGGGNDFMVTFGDAFWSTPGFGITNEDRSSTFMHEMGHTFDLRHGGGDNLNRKPNYHSVMNYNWQFRNGLDRLNFTAGLNYGASFELDYSTEKLPDLNEFDLDEPNGIGGAGDHADHLVPYGRATLDINNDPVFQQFATTKESGPADWNFNGTKVGMDLRRDINLDGFGDTLIGHDDWSSLRYYFLESRFFADGAHASDNVEDDEVVDRPPPKVMSVTINGGDSQRSRVTEVAITFDQPLTISFSLADAFEIKRQGDDKLPTLVTTVDSSGLTTVVTLTFLGTEAVDYGSLADGRYTLTIDASKVSNVNGQLDGDNDGNAGGNYVLASDKVAVFPDPYVPPTNIFRFFGDATGDGTVAINDFNLFRMAFGGTDNAFDFDNDGSVSNSDFNRFRSQFGGVDLSAKRVFGEPGA